jgi:hypothetical protein
MERVLVLEQCAWSVRGEERIEGLDVQGQDCHEEHHLKEQVAHDGDHAEDTDFLELGNEIEMSVSSAVFILL